MEIILDDKDFILLPWQYMPRCQRASNHAGPRDYR